MNRFQILRGDEPEKEDPLTLPLYNITIEGATEQPLSQIHSYPSHLGVLNIVGTGYDGEQTGIVVMGGPGREPDAMAQSQVHALSQRLNRVATALGVPAHNTAPVGISISPDGQVCYDVIELLYNTLIRMEELNARLGPHTTGSFSIGSNANGTGDIWFQTSTAP